MPRKARLDATGTLHNIIIRGIERRRIADDKRGRENFVFRIGSIVSVFEFQRKDLCGFKLNPQLESKEFPG